MNVKSANVKSAIAGLAFMSIAAFGVSARATGVNLITNGNFSNVTQGTTSLVENNAYGAAVQGWTTTSGYTFLLTASSSTGFYNGYIANGSGGSSGLYTGSGTPYQISLYSGITASPVGGNFIAQDANYLQGTLSQTVSGLTVGDTYAVSFYQAAAQQSGFTGSTGEQWFVSLGGQTDYAPQINIGQGAFSGWSYVTEMFTATATTETLGFFANGVGAPPFALLDGVSLVDAPEPATWTVMIMGLLGVASARRWARTRR